jgi:hypothetical protein
METYEEDCDTPDRVGRRRDRGPVRSEEWEPERGAEDPTGFQSVTRRRTTK